MISDLPSRARERAWIVDTHGWPTIVGILSLIRALSSAAATTVKVIGRILSAGTPRARKKATRATVVSVLPVPGPAETRTRTFSGAEAASYCAVLSLHGSERSHGASRFCADAARSSSRSCLRTLSDSAWPAG